MDRVGYVYDTRLLLHSEEPRITFPETPERISSIHAKLEDYNILSNLLPIPVTPADPSFVSTVHQQRLVEKLLDLKFDYSDMFNPKIRGKGVKYTMGKQLYDNEYTSDCIFLAAGGVINSVSAVLNNSVDYAFANVRPPGHHACFSSIGGFCYVNNVAIAAKYAQQYLGVKKIAIFDWDVHHGNGTQDIFKSDSSVLYVSAHRYDNAAFYPYLKESSAMFVGQGEGTGFNMNVAWDTEDPGNVSGISDGDYKLAFDAVISPVIDQFNPEIVLVSAGFDAMKDDPVGKLSLSPNIFAYMTYMLKKKHKLVLALEGGYNINNLQEGAYASVRALLRSSVDFSAYNPQPTQIGKDSLANTLEVNKEYWNIENYDLI